jgi:hypothetical protein
VKITSQTRLGIVAVLASAFIIGAFSLFTPSAYADPTAGTILAGNQQQVIEDRCSASASQALGPAATAVCIGIGAQVSNQVVVQLPIDVNVDARP